MTRPFLGYGRQCIDDADIAAVIDVLKSDFLTQGPAVERFEDAFAERTGARHAVAVANGTAALHLACLAAGLGPGDMAAVPTLTFVATANAPVYCGATVDLIDVELASRALAPADLRRFLEKRTDTKAVLPVHFAGLATDMAGIRAAAGRRIVIEDACHALGGTYEDGNPVGGCAHSDMSVFSFHPVKPITTGEGGAITTNDDGLAADLRRLRNHGIERDARQFSDAGEDEQGPWRYQQQSLGFNYRMTDLQAALGLAQLAKLDGFLVRRKEIASRYDEAFQGLPHLVVPQSSPEARARSGLHLYHLEVDFKSAGLTRSEMMAQLSEAGIGTQVHYIPVHRQPFHRARGDYENADFPNAERHYAGTLSIPLQPGLTDPDVDFVAGQITAMLT